MSESGVIPPPEDRQPEFYEGQPVRVTINAFIQDTYEDDTGHLHIVVGFQAGRRRLLEFPAKAEDVQVEAIVPP